MSAMSRKPCPKGQVLRAHAVSRPHARRLAVLLALAALAPAPAAAQQPTAIGRGAREGGGPPIHHYPRAGRASRR